MDIFQGDIMTVCIWVLAKGVCDIKIVDTPYNLAVLLKDVYLTYMDKQTCIRICDSALSIIVDFVPITRGLDI